MNIWQDIKWQYRYGSDLIKLILINIAVFITVNLINIPFILFAKTVPFNLVDFLSLYASPHNFVRHPWGIFTYMFIHEGFWHILWNMLGLYWFGQIVQDMIGKPKILPLYIFGGIFGGLLYMLAYNIFPLFSNAVAVSSCIGASAGVMAIVLAAATIAPNFELGFAIIGPVKIKWIALVYVVLDLINIQGGNAGGHIAHLGGALFGFVFIKQLQSGNDFTRPFYAVTDFFSNLFKKKSNLKVEYKKEYVYTSEKNTKSNTAQQKETISKQEKLDAILDKIKQQGYENLTAEEKDFLYEASKK